MSNAKSSQEATQSEHNLVFWFHVVVTLLAWVGPFLIPWWLLVPAYLLVLLQFLIFNRCLLNAQHDLKDENDTTFYSYLFEKMGWQPNRSTLKLWVRRYFYIILAAFTLLWQKVLGFQALVLYAFQ